MKAFIVDTDYENTESETIIKLFGRLENGRSFLSLHQYKPYFYIKTEDKEKANPLLKPFETQETTYNTFAEEPVTKILAKTQSDLNKLLPALKLKCITAYEADIRPVTRFLIDHNINASLEIKGESIASERVDRVYHNPDIQPAEYIPTLTLAAIDIESGEEGIYCIGIYAEKIKKVFIISDKKLENAVSCKDESDCLEQFKKELLKLDPDIITGWNIIDFDLDYLKKLAQKNKLMLDWGRTTENLKLRLEENFFKSSSATLTGRQVLDGMNFIKDPFIQEAPSIRNADFDTYTLEDVSQALLKEGKLLKGKGRHDEIEKLYKTKSLSSHQKLVDYNLQDCKLAYNILTKTKILELAIERSQLTSLPLDRLTASIAAFDARYIKEAHRRNLVSPTTSYNEKESPIKGGYVFSAKAGVYPSVAVLDFKSLYPSIIRTFNIDPASYTEETKNTIGSPNGAHFKNQEGILPSIIEELHQAREKAKKEKRELSSYAIKIIMNSFFGVLASPNCRYFNMEIANAITHFGQMFIKLTATEIEKLNYKVIYMDTDSVFVETRESKESVHQTGIKIQEHINTLYKEYIKKHYNRTSFLELQFSKNYISLMIPAVRGKEEETAAKKRYAGLLMKDGKEELDIVGLEAIRGDWTEAAQEFQKELLLKLFHNQPIESFIKDYIKKLRAGKMDEKLIYTKSIRKNLTEYTKTTPPHVKAARNLPFLESNIIQYYITENGPEPIQLKKSKLDYDHYIDKQIKPIANQILLLKNKTFEDTVENQKQQKLF